MKSNKLLWVNGITSILGGLLILYASSERWDWKIVDLVPKLVENSGWGINKPAVFGAFYCRNGTL